MPHFKPDAESLRDLDYTPRFICRLCGADAPAVCLSERKIEGGVVRELECPACRCLERVGIRLSEDCSGWALFQAEDATSASAPEMATPAGQES